MTESFILKLNSVWFGQPLLNAWVHIYQKGTSSLNRIISGIFNHH